MREKGIVRQRGIVYFSILLMGLLWSGASAVESIGFSFSDTSKLSGWMFADIENPSISNNMFYAKSTSDEPKMLTTLPAPIQADRYSHLIMEIKARVPDSQDYIRARMLWQRREDDIYSTERAVVYLLPNEERFVRVEIPLSHAQWNGEIRELMFSPIDGIGSFYIKYIIFKAKEAGWAPENARKYRFDFDDNTQQGWTAFRGTEYTEAREGKLWVSSGEFGGASLYCYFPEAQRLLSVPYAAVQMASNRSTHAKFEYYEEGKLHHLARFRIKRSSSPKTYYIKLRELYDHSYRYDSMLLVLDERNTGDEFRIDSIEFLRKPTAKVVLAATWQRFFAMDEIVPPRALIKLTLIGIVICAVVFFVRAVLRRKRFGWSEFEGYMRRSGSAIIIGVWFFLGALLVTEEWVQFWQDCGYLLGLDETGRAVVLLSDIQKGAREEQDADFIRFANYCKEAIPPLTPVWIILPDRQSLQAFATYYFFPVVLYNPARNKEERDYLITYEVKEEEIEQLVQKDKFAIYRRPNENCIIYKRKGR